MEKDGVLAVILAHISVTSSSIILFSLSLVLARMALASIMDASTLQKIIKIYINSGHHP